MFLSLQKQLYISHLKKQDESDFNFCFLILTV